MITLAVLDATVIPNTFGNRKYCIKLIMPDSPGGHLSSGVEIDLYKSNWRANKQENKTKERRRRFLVKRCIVLYNLLILNHSESSRMVKLSILGKLRPFLWILEEVKQR